MSDGLYSALSSAVAQTHVLDSIANNLSNFDTPGYKAQSVVFKEVYARASEKNGATPRDKAFVNIDDMSFSQQDGLMRTTGNPLDVAIDGPGFFCIKTPMGERYTRAGNLSVNRSGFLANQSGMPVLGQAGPIYVGDEHNITIDTEGVLRDAQGEPMAQLKVKRFENSKALAAEGGMLFRATPEAKVIRVANGENDFKIRSATLESSNVKPIEQTIKLIQANRLYDSAVKMIETYRNLDSKVVNEIAH